MSYDLSDCPDLSPYAADYRPDHPALDKFELTDYIAEAIDDKPRSHQTEIGPSEIGHPCARWLAYKISNAPVVNAGKPKWRAAVGTAVHDHFSDWLHRYNERYSFRWLFNIRVWIGDIAPGRPITGEFDALDTWTASVVDLKVPGPSSMKKHGPGKPENPQYEIQFDSYGAGAINAGFPVKNVGALRLPAAGELEDAVLDVRPHNPERAAAALARAQAITKLATSAGPAAAGVLPGTEHFCAGCPWFRAHSTDLTTGCPGAATFIEKRDGRQSTLNSLIA